MFSRLINDRLSLAYLLFSAKVKIQRYGNVALLAFGRCVLIYSTSVLKRVPFFSPHGAEIFQSLLKRNQRYFTNV